MNNDYTLFERYIEEGFKAIRCKGYIRRYNPQADYDTAKQAIDAGFTKEDFEGLKFEEAVEWVEREGWVGWLIPEGYIALDVEGAYKVQLVELICKTLGLNPLIHVTDRGKHYIFKLLENVPASSGTYTRCGLKVTYRVGGKNYLILAPINERYWEDLRPLSDAPDLPDAFMPYDPQDTDNVLRIVACLIGEAKRGGLLDGYEDIDAAFLAFMIDKNIPLETVKKIFQLIFLHEYDDQRTQYMYEHTKERMQAGEEVRGGGSFIQKIRDAGLTEIETLMKKLTAFDDHTTSSNNNRFYPKRLADELMSEFSFMYTGEHLYIYQDGAYRQGGEEFIRKQCRERLKYQAKTHKINEVIDHIVDLNRVDTDAINKQGTALINLLNGMLLWETGELLPHEPHYLSMIQIPITHDPGATCPEIDRFIETTLPSDCIDIVEEMSGYCLVPDVRFEKAFLFIGIGANGKSTFLNLLRAALGDSNVSTIPLQEIFDNRFKRAGLFGRLANIFTDIGSRALLDSSYFKAIVSGDSIDAEHKHKKPFHFKPHAKLLFSANEIPKSSDRTFAFYRRWVIIPFPFTFTGKKADRSLFEKLIAPSELSGLLNRALKGLRRLYENEGFSETESVRKALNTYKEENDSILAFVNSDCVRGYDYTVVKQKLYSAYEKFCEEQGLTSIGKNRFYKGIRGIEGVEEVRVHNTRLIAGIALIDDTDTGLNSSKPEDPPVASKLAQN